MLVDDVLGSFWFTPGRSIVYAEIHILLHFWPPRSQAEIEPKLVFDDKIAYQENCNHKCIYSLFSIFGVLLWGHNWSITLSDRVLDPTQIIGCVSYNFDF